MDPNRIRGLLGLMKEPTGKTGVDQDKQHSQDSPLSIYYLLLLHLSISPSKPLLL